MSMCLSVLADTLNALLPDCPTGNICSEVVDVSAGAARACAGCVRLTHLPTTEGVTVTSACGGVISADNYLMDYTSGTLYAFCVSDARVIVRYRYNLAETYIQQAVRDLGLRLPQRNTICTPLFANCGMAQLPCGVQRIDSIRISDCTCGKPTCNRCLRRPLCRCNGGYQFSCGPCGLYQRGDVLVVNPPPCEDQMLHLCYVGGYPLDSNGCFVGLTAELGDLVILKAQALAYSNPRLLFDLAGISSSTNTSSGESSGSDSTNDLYSETVTITKSYGVCGKEISSTKTTSGSKEKDRITSALSNRTNASNLLKSTQWLGLARQFQADYEKAILLRTESAAIGGACRRPSRYRAMNGGGRGDAGAGVGHVH